MIHNGVVVFRGSTKQADHGGGKRRAVKQNCYLIEIKVTD
jgi:hypothetical protein